MDGQRVARACARGASDGTFCPPLLASGSAWLPGHVDADGLIVREGVRAAATGRLVRNDLGEWFEPALPIAGPEGPERRVRPVWKGAVRVAGADFGAVAARFEKDGLVEGWATVTGTW